MYDLSIIHVDMDAFYASIEQRDNTFFRNKPIVVGGHPDGRGVVSTASYEARKFGIHSAMPARRARELCPGAIFLPVNMEKYKNVSEQIQNIFKDYTYTIEPISIDEAFLDMGEQHRDVISTAQEIKNRIYDELNLTASVGISYNKFLAKLASDMEKPNGFTVITLKDAKKILPTLPVRKIWGVGVKTEKELNDIGIFTIEDLLNYDREFILNHWGRRGYELLCLAQGMDNRPVEAYQQAKSIGEETTLSNDAVDKVILRNYIKDFAIIIGKRMNKQGIKCRTITVKIKYNDFRLITRSITLDVPTSSSLMIYSEANNILENRIELIKPVRLIGIQLSNLLYPHEPKQVTFEHFIGSNGIKNH
ncbi:MAG: DNA polymerase IV [Xylanivirga thermophila]|uniref:DNA polymerase IV n=1 Tax=Xylanivirga thermophila TaxID=2496273 RepID=UPI0039F52C4C